MFEISNDSNIDEIGNHQNASISTLVKFFGDIWKWVSHLLSFHRAFGR